jgi:hypothetical protein
VPAAPPSETDFEGLLRALSAAGVEFIVIGGVAAKAHGSPRLTVDLDVVYSRSADNLRRLTSALAPLEPYLRGAPPGLPFHFDIETVRRGLNSPCARLGATSTCSARSWEGEDTRRSCPTAASSRCSAFASAASSSTR